MADVLLIKIRQRAHFVGRAEILAIPGHHFVLPIRIERRPEHQDDVVENGIHFRIALGGHQFVRQRDGLLRACDLGGMQASVDVHDDLAFVSECFRRFVGQIAAKRQPPGDVLVFVELRQILRR